MDASFFEGKTLAITGGNGYLAYSLISILLPVECTIIRFDRAGVQMPPLQGKARIIDKYGDIRDSNDISFLVEKSDIIFHFAAQTSTYFSNSNPREDLEINVVPMIFLLESCKKSNRHPIIIFSSTVTIFGLANQVPVNELYSENVITLYDMHKKFAENYLAFYSRDGQVKGVALRLANLFGPGPKSSSSDRGILNQMILRALKGEDLTVFGKGQFIRDYIFVEDVAKAFLFAAINSDKLNSGFFNIGSGIGRTIADSFKCVAERVKIKTGKHSQVVFVEPPASLSPIENRNFVADTSLFSSKTGWKPLLKFTDGIDLTIDTFLERNSF